MRIQIKHKGIDHKLTRKLIRAAFSVVDAEASGMVALNHYRREWSKE